MGEKLTQFVVRQSGKERSTLYKALTLLFGATLFMVVIPALLGLLSHHIARYLMIHVPREVEIVLGVIVLIFGLFFILWSVLSFWFIGKGTPLPFAATSKLMTSGPFRYTRNPLKLGAFCYYFGLGTIFDCLSTGLIMFIIPISLGIFYHKKVEEKELLQRFGQEYEEYRRRTSFLIPWPPKK
ncbi:MAG: isoprenylcysteine carboxylmethyltransferase family protein [Thermoguttaceae bacterium]|jgi:protein-S-isoprenylcysteine O-methyltransferase Ste14